jgi:septal ring factor EnvC (AmiA/AmiB activator)
MIRRAWRRLAWVSLSTALLGGLPSATWGQRASAAERLRAQRDSLERIRQERRNLERQMETLRGRAHSISDEVKNLAGQRAATARAVRMLDLQLAGVTREVSDVTAQLVGAQDELAVKRATLQRRLSDIYKRGPLFTLEVMLSAASFGELVARYKYLHELARRDKGLVERVRELTDQIDRQRRSLVRLQADVSDTRDERAREERRFQALAAERESALRRVERDASEAEQRLAAIARDEQKLNTIIASLEAERRRAASRGGRPAPAPAGSAFSAGANLAWPVDGDILYPFGRAEGPDRTTITWTGIGIRAPSGTPVRSIAAGVVKLVDPHFGTYGATVVILHPTGEYSLYCSLGSITVTRDQIVNRGQQIGTVGVNDPRLGPHLHFEIRSGGNEPIPVDPLQFLRPRG